MYTKYLCLKARRVSLSSIHFSFVICSLMQMNWPQANRFITWQHIHKASSIQRKESWTTVTEDTKKCTHPKLMSLAINRLNFYPNSYKWHEELQVTHSRGPQLPEEYNLPLIGSSKPSTKFLKDLKKAISRFPPLFLQKSKKCNYHSHEFKFLNPYIYSWKFPGHPEE